MQLSHVRQALKRETHREPGDEARDGRVTPPRGAGGHAPQGNLGALRLLLGT